MHPWVAPKKVTSFEVFFSFLFHFVKCLGGGNFRRKLSIFVTSSPLHRCTFTKKKGEEKKDRKKKKSWESSVRETWLLKNQEKKAFLIAFPGFMYDCECDWHLQVSKEMSVINCWKKRRRGGGSKAEKNQHFSSRPPSPLSLWLHIRETLITPLFSLSGKNAKYRRSSKSCRQHLSQSAI